ncbi:MAG: hypothetical protein WBD10_00740 [Acidobacteriaceae bacterium]
MNDTDYFDGSTRSIWSGEILADTLLSGPKLLDECPIYNSRINPMKALRME